MTLFAIRVSLKVTLKEIKTKRDLSTEIKMVSFRGHIELEPHQIGLCLGLFHLKAPLPPHDWDYSLLVSMSRC